MCRILYHAKWWIWIDVDSVSEKLYTKHQNDILNWPLIWWHNNNHQTQPPLKWAWTLTRFVWNFDDMKVNTSKKVEILLDGSKFVTLNFWKTWKLEINEIIVWNANWIGLMTIKSIEYCWDFKSEEKSWIWFAKNKFFWLGFSTSP